MFSSYVSLIINFIFNFFFTSYVGMDGRQTDGPDGPGGPGNIQTFAIAFSIGEKGV